jgi:hypothetical protein
VIFRESILVCARLDHEINAERISIRSDFFISRGKGCKVLAINAKTEQIYIAIRIIGAALEKCF